MESTPGSRLRHLRELLGFEGKQQEFADRIGLTQQSVSNMERDKTEPAAKSLNKIYAAFAQVNISWLVTGAGDPLDTMRDGRTLSQLPPPIPSKHEAAEPAQPYWRVTADSEELKQVKDERDNLRRQVDRLLGLLEANTYALPVAAVGGKAEASADAATLYAVVDRLCVNGLKRYPEAQEEPSEAAHFSIDGQRVAEAA